MGRGADKYADAVAFLGQLDENDRNDTVARLPARLTCINQNTSRVVKGERTAYVVEIIDCFS